MLSLFTMQTDGICCVSLSSWVRDPSSLRCLSSWAVLQQHHSTALILKPPEDFLRNLLQPPAAVSQVIRRGQDHEFQAGQINAGEGRGLGVPDW